MSANHPICDAQRTRSLEAVGLPTTQKLPVKPHAEIDGKIAAATRISTLTASQNWKT